MYATVRSYAGAEGLADALADRQDDVRGVIQSIAGFQDYVLIRTGDGSTVTVSVFEDQAGAEESNRAAADWMRSNLPDFAASSPQVSAGEVVVRF